MFAVKNEKNVIKPLILINRHYVTLPFSTAAIFVRRLEKLHERGFLNNSFSTFKKLKVIQKVLVA